MQQADIPDSERQSDSEFDESSSAAASEDSDLDRAQAQLEERGSRLEPESDVHVIERNMSQERAHCDGQLEGEGGVRRTDREADDEPFLSNFTGIETDDSVRFLYDTSIFVLIFTQFPDRGA
jgi:hypothetical protein